MSDKVRRGESRPRWTHASYTTTQTNTVLVTVPSSQVIKIIDLWMSTSDGTTVTLKIGASTFGKFYFAANGGMVTNNQNLIQTQDRSTKGEDLTISTSGNNTISITVYYYLESAFD